MINKCDVCGKFRRWDDLILQYSPDNAFSGETGYQECIFCIAKTEARLKDPTFKIISQIESDMYVSTASPNKLSGLLAQLNVKQPILTRVFNWFKSL